MLIDIDVEPVSEYRWAKLIVYHVKLQIWSCELTMPTLWPSGALSGCCQHLRSKNVGGHVTLATPPFQKIRVMCGLSLQETCTPNLKSVALTVLELLAFNAQKFMGSHDPGHAHLGALMYINFVVLPRLSSA